jgi:hypothetical protein
LLAFAGGPVSGMVCALLCESAATQNASHHGKDPKCAEPATPPSGSQISSASAHDCGAHASMRQVAIPAAERAHLSAKVALTVGDSSSHNDFVLPHDGKDPFTYISPPGTDPPTVRPVVLRV